MQYDKSFTDQGCSAMSSFCLFMELDWFLVHKHEKYRAILITGLVKNPNILTTLSSDGDMQSPVFEQRVEHGFTSQGNNCRFEGWCYFSFYFDRDCSMAGGGL